MREKMRKKWNRLLLLGMVFMCVSCGKAAESDNGKPITEYPVSGSEKVENAATITPGTVTVVPDITPIPTLTPTPTVTPTPTPSPTPTSTPTPTPIPAWKQVGEKWECGSEQYHIYHEEIGYADAVLGLNGKLLQISQFCVEPEDYSTPSYCAIQMSIYNPNTNTVEVSKDYPWNGYVIYNTGLLDDNRFYVFEDEAYCYNIYNEALELEKQLSSDGFCYDNGALSSDGATAYYGEIGGKIYRVTTDGEEVLYQNKAWEEPYAKAVLLDNRYLEVSYYTTDPEEYASHTAYLDLETLEIVEDLEGTYAVSVSPDGELCLLQSLNPTNRLQVYRTADRSLVSKIDFQTVSECYNYVLDWENAICLTYTECSDEGYRTTWEKKVYDLHTGEVKAAVVEEETQFGYEYKSVMLGSGVQAAYMTDREAVYYLSVWDYMNETCTDTSAFFPRYGVISEELKQYRDELEKKHGVFFYIGTEVAAADFAYECQVVTDEEKIYEALRTIDEILELYPDSFFEQLKVGGIRNLGFYLAGNLKGKYASSLDYADGLASDNGYERCIVLDIRSWSLRSNLFHEISHWIDNYIERKEMLLGETSYEDGFAKLNPEDFEYSYSYVSGESVRKYIYYFDEMERMEEFYFIDSYAQTFPTEDRARCFEYLMTEGREEYLKCPHIYQKMEYIAKSIRQYFDTEGWPEKTAWELEMERIKP